MTGDEGGKMDAAEGLAFLDRFLAIDTANINKKAAKERSLPHHHKARCHGQSRRPARRFDHAVDLGAGVGRLTKLLLLKRYGEVRLVEADEGWSKRSRVYLGRKRASRCSFSNQRVRHRSSSTFFCFRSLFFRRHTVFENQNVLALCCYFQQSNIISFLLALLCHNETF